MIDHIYNQKETQGFIFYDFQLKTSQNKRNFKNVSKGRYFLLGCCRNVNFGLF